MRRILLAQLVDPPLRMRVAAGFAFPGRLEHGFAPAQEVSQHRVDEAFGRGLALSRGCAHGVVHDRVGCRACVDQLIERNAQEIAQALVLERPLEQRIEHGVDLPQEAQRAVAGILQRRAILGVRPAWAHTARSSASRLRPDSTRPTTCAARRCSSSISYAHTQGMPASMPSIGRRTARPVFHIAAGEKSGGGQAAPPCPLELEHGERRGVPACDRDAARRVPARCRARPGGCGHAGAPYLKRSPPYESPRRARD